MVVTVRRVATLVACTSLALASFAAHQRYGTGIVSSGSMKPALLPGDMIVYRRDVAIGRGDVLLYEKSGWPRGVVHRVVECLPDGSMRTKGDANPVPDRDAVTARDVRGRVVIVVPSGHLFALVTPRR